MSSIATFDVYYETRQEIPVSEIIEMYLANGWSFDDGGHISLRPLGDKDDFDWVELELDQKNELYEIIKKKIEAGEDPAIVMHIPGEAIITTFFPREKRIDFLLMCRKRHPEQPAWTDVGWYIAFIYDPLVKNEVSVSRIDFSETI